MSRESKELKEKILIKKKFGSTSLSGFLYDGMNLNQVMEAFTTEISNWYKIYPEFTEIKMDFEYEYGYYNDCSFVVKFIGERIETDEEFTIRKELLKKKSQAGKLAYKQSLIDQEEREKSLYQKLKAKFEK